MRAAPLLPLLLLAACGSQPDRLSQPQGWEPPIGSNTVFDAEPGAAPEKQLIVADLRLGPNAVGAAHYHPWEEYLYVIGGSAIVDFGDGELQMLEPGESFIIPAGKVHTPRAGADGVRAIVTRVHNAGDPVSVPAPEADASK